MEDSIYASATLLVRTREYYLWQPQEDITAYELALCLPVILSRHWDITEAVKELPEAARRHFSVEVK